VWARFDSTIGHVPENWDRPEVQAMYLGAIKWALGLVKADARPRPVP
jgi:type 1 glutamine amidotransferase